MTGRLMNAEFDRFVEAGIALLVSARDQDERPLPMKVDPHLLAQKLLVVLQEIAGVEFTEFGNVDVNPAADLVQIAGIAA